MSLMTSVRQLLQDARDRIARPQHWCQGRSARDDRGRPVGATSFVAVRFTIQAALARAAWSAVGDEPHPHLVPAVRLLREALPEGFRQYGLDDFNDRTTHQEVLALLDRAIAATQEASA